MIQQQLLYTQMQMQIQHQQSKEGGGAEEGETAGGGASVASTTASDSSTSHHGRCVDAVAQEAGSATASGTQGSGTECESSSSKYINGSDVMIGVHSQAQSRGVGRSRPPTSRGDEGNSKAIPPPGKKAKLDSSSGPIQ